jgi:hypothetical protein
MLGSGIMLTEAELRTQQQHDKQTLAKESEILHVADITEMSLKQR